MPRGQRSKGKVDVSIVLPAKIAVNFWREQNLSRVERKRSVWVISIIHNTYVGRGREGTEGRCSVLPKRPFRSWPIFAGRENATLRMLRVQVGFL
jgi:hypothetical protein